MPNGTYGGVRGRKTKVGRKLLRFPPTRFMRLNTNPTNFCLTQNPQNWKENNEFEHEFS